MAQASVSGFPLGMSIHCTYDMSQCLARQELVDNEKMPTGNTHMENPCLLLKEDLCVEQRWYVIRTS
jgi:hypothetical protein